MTKTIKINKIDNVAVALSSLDKGAVVTLESQTITLGENIPRGHKFALEPIQRGASIIKYGAPIGVATKDISSGAWVHTHNIRTGLEDLLTYSYHKNVLPLPATSPRFFQGYKRENGKVGVRNKIWIIPTVGCLNSVIKEVERQSQKYVSENVESITSFPHPYGCSQVGEDQKNTYKILANLINHPNAGGVLVMGLGCENTTIQELKKYIGEHNPNRVRFLVAHNVEDEVTEAIKLVEELADYASLSSREPIPCSELIVGLKCGGSDGLSGITANPVVGAFSDLLISKGGTTILTEVPEMFGAETILMNRCDNESLWGETVALINDFKTYFKNHNQPIYENPSPGNKEGGLSTLEDKSLGCTQKSGTAPVKGVLAYGEAVKETGLNLLSSPGNDLVAATALAASGAQIVLFTTGLGTPFASPVPTIKISSNSELAIRKANWIDFNCGEMVEGKPLEVVLKELFDFVMDIASGRLSKAEKAGYHDMAIFKQGVTL